MKEREKVDAEKGKVVKVSKGILENQWVER